MNHFIKVFFMKKNKREKIMAKQTLCKEFFKKIFYNSNTNEP